MMIARLSTLLVAGSLLSTALPHAGAAEVGRPPAAASLDGLRVERTSDQDMAILLSIPAYAGTPRVQVLPGKPDRVVLDLPGVRKGDVSRQALQTIDHPLVIKRRLAQFSEEPVPVTRMVLEVKSGTQVAVERMTDGVRLVLQRGTGSVVARVLPDGTQPVVAAPVAPLQAAPVQVATVVEPRVEAAPLVQVAAVAPAPVKVAPLQALPTFGNPVHLLPSLVHGAVQPPAPMNAKAEQPARTEETKGRRVLGEVRTRYTGATLTIDQVNMDLSQYLRAIAEVAHMNLIADPEVKGITVDLSFKNTPWDQVLDVVLKQYGLGKTIENGVIRVAKLDKLKKEEEEAKQLEEAKALAGPIQTRTIPLSFAKASTAQAIVGKVLTKRGSIFIDDRTNTLFITDLPQQWPLIEELINTLDVAIQQVSVEARIVEADVGFGERFGVQWPSKSDGRADLKIQSTSGGSTSSATAPWVASSGPYYNGASGDRGGRGYWGAWTSDLSVGAPAGEFWLSALSKNFNINVILQAAQDEGKVKVVSNPKVVCFNNEKGSVLSGEKIPYPVVQAGQNGGAITVQFMDANLKLDVTPQITNDGSIIMDLMVENSSADFTKSVNGTPTLLTKQVTTKVLVKNGGTAVLGGIYITRTSNTTKGIPYLRKLPVLGALFRSSDNQEQSRELLVFITPKILGKE